MTQPALGLVASAIVMVVALVYISLFPLSVFLGWVSFFMLGLIPMQVAAVVLWGGNPDFVKSLGQPAKGLSLFMVTVIASVVTTVVVYVAVGESVSPPGPIPSHYAVVVVPTTFWLTIMLGGWPFTSLIKSPIVAGLTVVAAAYVLTYVEFRLLFDYSFMEGAPVYLASAPRGMFNAVYALVFHVTALAVMFLVLCFDLWPISASPGLMKQPVLGIVWSAICLAGAGLAMWIGVGVFGMDPMSFLTGVTVPFIFGSIIVLNMLQNSLFAATKPPLKGVLNAIAAAALGVALAQLYSSVAPAVSGPLQAGPPAYDLEVWLANALLSVTFPFLIYYAVFLEYWPIRRAAAGAASGASART